MPAIIINKELYRRFGTALCLFPNGISEQIEEYANGTGNNCNIP